jgi:hypothetical protein
MLATAYRAGVGEPAAGALLEGAVCRVVSEHAAVDTSLGQPLSWCWGDLGVAIALMHAARATKEQKWEAAALAIARECAQIASKSWFRDASICHGASGAAHMFNRLYQATLDDDFAVAARHCARQALGMRRPRTGIAGYEFFVDIDRDKMGWAPTPGLLQGLAGAALALAGTICLSEPRWDEFLLVAIPPPGDAT